uniref:Uncharacterized protein n=1 Tax=Caenorhabditis japonica TaxID=281687 RepID=A0A8R1HLZ8_CAEJA
MSKKTRDLHRQLFLTLVLQSIFPCVTLFMPVALLFFIPFLNCSTEFGIWANAPGAYISFYPAVDALIAIFMIKDFRNAVMCELFGVF